jgi:hypothetical protein
MGESTSFRIALHTPKVQQISLASIPPQIIGVVTPVAHGMAKLTIDTSSNWATRTFYIPAKGEIIVYSDRHVIDSVNYPGVKIGDGLAYVVDLPFVGDDISNQIAEALNLHINDSASHVSAADRENWNNKVSCIVLGENLIFEGGGLSNG